MRTQLLSTIVSLAFLLIGTEVILRAKGFRPWQIRALKNEPVVHEPDPTLGWRNRPGEYHLPNYKTGKNSIRMTIHPNHTRKTGDFQTQIKDPLAIFGASFAQGWHIADSETFAWKLQNKFPQFNVLNFGTGGFTVFQSLLQMEQKIKSLKPAIAIYTLTFDHIHRTEEPYQWLATLTEYSKRGQLSLPYAELHKDKILRRTPVTYPKLPLRKKLASVKYLEDKYMKWKLDASPKKWGDLSKGLLIEMGNFWEKKNIPFAIALLGEFAPIEESLKTHFRKYKIPYIDCTGPLTVEYISQADHPNERMNKVWASCIEQGIIELNYKKRLSLLTHEPGKFFIDKNLLLKDVAIEFVGH